MSVARKLVVACGLSLFLVGLIVFMCISLSWDDNLFFWLMLSPLRSISNIELLSLGAAVLGFVMFLTGLVWRGGGE